jgi:mRNA interferase RelE/StbE
MPRIVWDNKAVNQLNKLNLLISRRIFKNIEELKENPFSKGIKKLVNSIYYRLRVGDYRIIFRINQDNIIIVKIGHRKNVYKI